MTPAEQLERLCRNGRNMTKTPLSTGVADLLSDATLQLAMTADGVHRAGLRDMLESVSSAGPADTNWPDGYRRGVGMMVIDGEGRILIGQRADQTAPAWQMPQRGIAEGEHPHQAALRELHEEIGTQQCRDRGGELPMVCV